MFFLHLRKENAGLTLKYSHVCLHLPLSVGSRDERQSDVLSPSIVKTHELQSSRAAAVFCCSCSLEPPQAPPQSVHETRHGPSPALSTNMRTKSLDIKMPACLK